MFRPPELRKIKGLECVGEMFTHSSQRFFATIPPMPTETSYSLPPPGIPFRLTPVQMIMVV